MNWNKFRARTVREEQAATEQANHLSHRYAKFEEAYRALTWLLSRRCDQLPLKWRSLGSKKYYLYVQDSHPIAKTPWIAVVFTYDDHVVSIIDISAGQ